MDVERVRELSLEAGQVTEGIAQAIERGAYDREQAHRELAAFAERLKGEHGETRRLVLGPLLRFQANLPQDGDKDAIERWVTHRRLQRELFTLQPREEGQDGRR